MQIKAACVQLKYQIVLDSAEPGQKPESYLW